MERVQVGVRFGQWMGLLRPTTFRAETRHFLPCLLWAPVRWSVVARLLYLIPGAGLVASDLWEVARVSTTRPYLRAGRGGTSPDIGTSSNDQSAPDSRACVQWNPASR